MRCTDVKLWVKREDWYKVGTNVNGKCGHQQCGFPLGSMNWFSACLDKKVLTFSKSCVWFHCDIDTQSWCKFLWLLYSLHLYPQCIGCTYLFCCSVKSVYWVVTVVTVTASDKHSSFLIHYISSESFGNFRLESVGHRHQQRQWICGFIHRHIHLHM